jgi:hypothetical protein
VLQFQQKLKGRPAFTAPTAPTTAPSERIFAVALPAFYPDPSHECIQCRRPILRHVFPSGSMEAHTRWHQRKFCSRACAHAHRRPENPSPALGRQRANRLFPLDGPCKHCGRPAQHRHHIDGNSLNNRPENIALVCARCHVLVEHPESIDRLRAARPAGQNVCISCGQWSKHIWKDRCPRCYAQHRRAEKHAPKNT